MMMHGLANVKFGLSSLGKNVLRKVLGLKRDWVTGVWRRLQNQELL